MESLNVNNDNLVEDFFSTTDNLGGYVVVISKDKIAQSRVFSNTHDVTLSTLLNQIGDPIPSGDNNNYWIIKQRQGYVLMRMIKGLNIVYMPEYLSKFQFDMVNDVQTQIENYKTRNNSNVIVCVSDGESSYYFDEIAKLKEYLDSKKPYTK